MLRQLIKGSFVISMFTLSTMSMAEKLDLSEGTMSISGRAQVAYDSSNIAALGTFSGDLNWGFGYFVADNFLVGFDILAGGDFSATPRVRGGIGPHFLYAFDTDSIVSPYLQLGVDINWHQGGGTAAGTDRWNVGVKPAVGLLIGLNAHVALDAGLSTAVNIPISGAAVASATSLHAAIGHIGVRGFF